MKRTSTVLRLYSATLAPTSNFLLSPLWGPTPFPFSFLDVCQAIIRAFAPPVSRGGCYHNGNLYVEVGTLNRHKGATVQPSRKSPHFSAQIQDNPIMPQLTRQKIIPPSKDKARAKMPLLEAPNYSRMAQYRQDGS